MWLEGNGVLIKWTIPKIFKEAYIKINTITLFQIEMTQSPGYNAVNQGISLSERPLPSTPGAQVPEYLQLADYIEPYYSTAAPYDVHWNLEEHINFIIH